MDVQALLTDLDQASRRIRAPQDFIEAGLPALQQALAPVAHAIRLYRVMPEGLIFMQSIPSQPDQASEVLPYTHYPLHHQVLSAGEIGISPDNRFIVAPLAFTRAGEALLEVEVAPHSTPADASSSLRDQVSLATQIFQLKLADTLKTWALEKLTDISADLTQATDLESIGAVLARHLLTRGQFTSINLLDYDLNGEMTGFWIMTTISSRHAFAPNLYIPMDAEDRTLFSPIQHNDDLVFYEPSQTVTNPQLRQLLIDARVRAMHTVPLQVGGRTIGFINTNDTRVLLTTLEAERRVLRAICGQVGAIIENRRLLTETETALNEAKTLYDATRRLMSAATLPDVLMALYEMFAGDEGRVSLIEYEYDEAGRFTNNFIRYLVQNGTGQVHDIPMYKGIDDEEITLIQSKLDAQGEAVWFIQDIGETWADLPNLVAQLEQMHTRSLVSFSLWDGARRTRQIDLIWPAPRRFTSNERRLFSAIHAQVQIVARNQMYVERIQTSAQTAEQQVRLLERLNEVNAISNTVTDETQFLQKISPLLRQAFQADNFSYSVREPNRQTFILSFTDPKWDVPADVRVFQQLPVDESGGDKVWFLRDVSQMPLDANLKRIYEIYNIKSQILMGIFDGQQELIAVIGLGYQAIFDPGETSRRLAQTFGTQINLSIQKIQLLARSQQQARQMQQLALFSQSVQAVLDETAILRTTLHDLRHVIAYEYLTLLLIAETDVTQLVQAAYATPAEAIILAERRPYDLAKDAIAREAWASKHTAYAENVRRTWTWEHPLRASLGSILAAPLFLGGRAVGVIEIGSAATYAYSETDTTALLQVGNQIALALENANDLERTERLARNRALANRISTVMQEQMDVETILQSALKEVGRAVGARRARIRLGSSDLSSP